MRFANQTAVVTGAGRGIGQATVARLLAEGARVLAVDQAFATSDAAPDASADERLCRLQLDLTRDEAPQRVREALAGLGGQAHLLVNNAGVGGSRPLAVSDDELIDRMLAVNLRAVLRLTRELLPCLHDGGSIVNVGSVFGETGYPGTTPYAVTKAGISQFTRQLVCDLSSRGIRVNAVAPGVIRTPMTEQHLTRASYRQAMVHATPLQRVGTAEEVAAVIAFLASAEASYVSGQVIAVDGGWLACRTHAAAMEA